MCKYIDHRCAVDSDETGLKAGPHAEEAEELHDQHEQDDDILSQLRYHPSKPAQHARPVSRARDTTNLGDSEHSKEGEKLDDERRETICRQYAVHVFLCNGRVARVARGVVSDARCIEERAHKLVAY